VTHSTVLTSFRTLENDLDTGSPHLVNRAKLIATGVAISGRFTKLTKHLVRVFLFHAARTDPDRVDLLKLPLCLNLRPVDSESTNDRFRKLQPPLRITTVGALKQGNQFPEVVISIGVFIPTASAIFVIMSP